MAQVPLPPTDYEPATSSKPQSHPLNYRKRKEKKRGAVARLAVRFLPPGAFLAASECLARSTQSGGSLDKASGCPSLATDPRTTSCARRCQIFSFSLDSSVLRGVLIGAFA